MKNKIIGILICMLMIVTIFPVVESVRNNAINTTGLSLSQLKKTTIDAYIYDNNPPLFGAPSPLNNSINNPLNFTWNIQINDTEGDLFSWNILCSNGQSNNGSNELNGTKSLVLSGLDYSTTYLVCVNATDPMGSAIYRIGWYKFTTKQNNNPPVFGAPSPGNDSIVSSLNFTWKIPINDTEGDQFFWQIECSNGQNNSATNATNGTKSLYLFNLEYSKVYTVWVNATDPTGSGQYTRAWYKFLIKTNINQPPVFNLPYPVNGSTNNTLNLTWSIKINDIEGDLFSWTIQCSNGYSNNSTSTSNGTKSLNLSGLAYLTTYSVWVNATDPTGSGKYTRAWYTFTTKGNHSDITISASPNILWPPNHKMKNVFINGSINTGGSDIVSIIITVDDEYHLVEPTITSFNTTIQLEAWRFGNDKDGRTYTITVTIIDNLGHITTASTIVRVPHDQRN